MNRITQFAPVALIALLALAAPLAAQHYIPAQACANLTQSFFTHQYTYPNTADPKTVDILALQPPGVLNMPIVIWSHGGGEGTVAPMSDWAAATGLSCYFSVSLGHTLPSTMAATNFCASQNPPIAVGPDCEEAVKKTYKAFDISAAIDFLETLSAPGGPLEGIINTQKIVVGGHSGGASAMMQIAGAKRHLGTPLTPNPTVEDTRPVAFVGLSPTGPSYAGFYDKTLGGNGNSWDSIIRPMLTITGDGDHQCTGQDWPYECENLGGKAPPWNRRAPFHYSPGVPGSATTKYQLYINDTDAYHNLYRRNTSRCAVPPTATQPVNGLKCGEIIDHFDSAVLAFIDFWAGSQLSGLTYLESHQIETAHPSLNVSWRIK